MSEPVIDAKWAGGINSILESSLIPETHYQWGQNIDNTGAIISTRQGFNLIGASQSRMPALEPKGGFIFKDKNGAITIVIAIGSEMWGCSYPFMDDFKKIGDGFVANKPVIFCKAFKSLNLKIDGTTEVIEPYPVLIAQNGIEKPKYWDGSVWKDSKMNGDETNGNHREIPAGTWMQWSGGRLWVANGQQLHASDFGDPISFFEETFVSGGGALMFEDEITGLNQTPNLQSLLVCTDFNTSVVQSNVTDRTQWGNTPGFQSVFLPGIGCAAGKSFARQWGMTWWYSHGGLICLDQAINTYRSSRIIYRDQEMMRSKSNMADDISGIASTSFGNYLLVSVPSGSRYNAQTWVLNQNPIDIYGTNELSSWSSSWNGLRPVELMTAVINGQQRTFALSRDEGDSNQAFYPNVWELFTGERQDRFNETIFQPPCLLETRLLAFSQELKKFRYAEIDIAELVGRGHIDVYVASRRGGYHQILSKDLVAAEGGFNSSITAPFITKLENHLNIGATTMIVTTTEGSLPAPASVNIEGHVFNYSAKTGFSFTIDPSEFSIGINAQVIQPQFSYPSNDDLVSFVPQRRMLRTEEWNIKENEDYSGPTEANLNDNIDRGFSLLIKWTGRLAITGLRVFTEKVTDQTMGQGENLNEELSRSLDDHGIGEVSSTVIEPLTIDTPRLKSNYLRVITPRPIEDYYRPLP